MLATRVLIVEDDPILNDQLAAMLRIEALLRRCQNQTPQEAPTLSLDGLCVDRAGKTVTANDRSLELTLTQFKLLWTLLMNRGEVHRESGNPVFSYGGVNWIPTFAHYCPGGALALTRQLISNFFTTFDLKSLAQYH